VLQLITDPDCNGDLNLMKIMNDLVFDSWKKCSLTGFVFSIYKKGSNVLSAGFFLYLQLCM